MCFYEPVSLFCCHNSNSFSFFLPTSYSLSPMTLFFSRTLEAIKKIQVISHWSKKIPRASDKVVYHSNTRIQGNRTKTMTTGCGIQCPLRKALSHRFFLFTDWQANNWHPLLNNFSWRSVCPTLCIAASFQTFDLVTKSF